MRTDQLQRVYDTLIAMADNAYRTSEQSILSDHFLGRCEGLEDAAQLLLSNAHINGYMLERRMTKHQQDIDNARREEAQSEAFNKEVADA